MLRPDYGTVVAAVVDFHSLAGYAERITCPTFVANAEADDISASAPQLVAALRCPHEFRTFTTAEGAGDHCEAGARTLFHARAFAWLDDIMRPSAGVAVVQTEPGPPIRPSG